MKSEGSVLCSQKPTMDQYSDIYGLSRFLKIQGIQEGTTIFEQLYYKNE
jgi:hypothetical protein